MRKPRVFAEFTPEEKEIIKANSNKTNILGLSVLLSTNYTNLSTRLNQQKRNLAKEGIQFISLKTVRSIQLQRPEIIKLTKTRNERNEKLLTEDMLKDYFIY